MECEFPTFHGPETEGSDSVLRMQLQANGLEELLAETAQDRRLYELWALQQPGDVCAYLEVRLLSDEASLLARLSSWMSEDEAAIVGELVSGRSVPLARFETLFPDLGDDTETGAWQWARLRTDRVREFLTACLEQARQHLNELRLRNVIAEHVVRRLELEEHAFSFLSRDKALAASWHASSSPNGNAVSAPFLETLASCLMEAGINSVLIAGNSIDRAVIRTACIEQRSRVALFGNHPWHTFPVAVLADEVERVPEEWESAVAVDWEGTPRGDLWVNLQRNAGEKDFWAARPRGQMALCVRDRGEIAGFERMTGDGWTLYVTHNVDSQRAANSSPRGSKLVTYRKLVIERKQCRACQSLTNPSDPALQRYDGAEIGPWTRWQRDLNAQVLVVGQDWGGSIAYLNQQGVDVDSPTNRALSELLGTRGYVIQPPHTGPTLPRQDNAVFLTNSVLCIKQGADSGALRRAWVRNCGGAFLRRQIELIEPHAVVSLGYEAYRAVMWAFGEVPLQTMEAAVATTPRLAMSGGRGLLLVPNFHCGRLGLGIRPMAQQEADWSRVPYRQ